MKVRRPVADLPKSKPAVVEMLDEVREYEHGIKLD